MSLDLFLTFLAAIVVAIAILYAWLLYQERSEGICISLNMAAIGGATVGDEVMLFDDRGRPRNVEIVAIGDANTVLVKPAKPAKRRAPAVNP